MGDKPTFRIVQGPWIPKTSTEKGRWTKDLGALWPRKEGKEGYSGQILMPDGTKESILVLPVKADFDATAPAVGNTQQPPFEDDSPIF